MRLDSLKIAQKKYLSRFEPVTFRVLPEQKAQIKEFLEKNKISLKEVFYRGLESLGYVELKQKKKVPKNTAPREITLKVPGKFPSVETSFFPDGYVVVNYRSELIKISNPYWDIQKSHKKITHEYSMKILGKKRKSKAVYDYTEALRKDEKRKIHQKAANRLRKWGTVYRGKILNGVFKGKLVIFERRETFTATGKSKRVYISHI